MAAQELANIAIKLSADMVDFENDMGRASRLAQKRSGQMRKSFNQAFKAISVAALAAGGALATLVKVSANTADNIQKLSLRLGVSTEFLSEMRHVADLTGVSFDRVDVGIRKMSKSINDAENGLSTSIRAFDSLGISLEELKSLSPEQQFELIADKLSKVETQSEKTGAAMDIFGRAGVDMLTLFEDGAKGIKDMREEANLFGLTISQDAADGAAHFNDEITKLGARAQGFAESLGLSLLPALSEIIAQFNSDGISNADNDFQGLQTTIGNVYGAVLFLKGGYEVVGEAVAVMVTKSLNAFDVVKNSLESFVKRFERGALIISSVWDESANEAERKLGAEIQKLSEQTDALLAQFNNNDVDDAFFAKANEIWDEATKKMNAVKDAHKNTAKQIKKDGKIIKDGSKTIENLGDTAKTTAADLNKIQNAFDQIVDSFMTPLDQLKEQYFKNIQAIDDWLSVQDDFDTAMVTAANLTNQLTAEFDENTKAIESQLTPYEELLASLDEELRLLGANSAELIENNAKRLLVQAGVIKAGDSFDKYGDEIEAVTEKLEKLNAEQGVFGNGINSFSDLLRSASSDFSSFFDTLTKGFKSMGKDADSFAEGVGSITDFASNALGIFDSTAGQDDAGRILDTVAQIASSGVLGPVAQAIAQVATFIDSITGGSLFGTSYEVQGSTRNINIGEGGAGGGIQTRESRRRSLFRGTQRRTTDTELDSATLGALDTLFESLQIAIQNSAIAVGGVAGDIIAGSFAEEFDKDGNLVSSISTVLGRTFNESFEEFSQRLTAENILAGIGTVFEEVGQIAERWRHDAETLLEGSQLLLIAGADISSGGGLFESLETVADVITDMNKFGETLSQTYERVQGSVLLLDEALSIIGTSFDLGRVEYVNLAADIADAAGGLPQAASLWKSYFETFYTEQELFEQSLSSATEIRNASLEGLGLDAGISTEAFRQLFETALPSLSAEAIVEWLRAADAMGVVIDLEADLNAQREQDATDLASLLGEVSSALEDMDLSDFALSLKQINKAFDEQIATARRLGATERELAMIQRFATRQIQDAIAALEADLSSGITDLYDTGLESINDQISALQEQQSLQDQVAQANYQRYQDELSAIQSIMGFVDSLLLSSTLSTLNPLEQLNEAQSQFDEMFALAQGGDVDAINALPSLVNTLLGLGRENYSSSQEYTDLFDTLTGQLSSLGIDAGGGVSAPPASTADPRLIELLQRQTELQQEIANGERGQAVLELANQIRELTGVTGESFSNLAERLGLPIEQFLSDLGVDLENLTDETSIALADVAFLLGAELSDVAESVGVSLGNLADANSLLNNALENAIGGLPEGIQDSLTDLLTGVENAADGTDQEAALNELIAFADTLPDDYRNVLAPFFEQIDPTSDAQMQLNTLAEISQTNSEMKTSIEGVKSAVNSSGELINDGMGRLNDGFSDLAREIRNIISQLAA